MGPIQNRAGKLMSLMMSTWQRFSIPFCLCLYWYSWIPNPKTSSYDNSCVNPPVVEEGLVCSLLQVFDPCKSIDLDRIRPRVLKGDTHFVARPLFIIFEKSWMSGHILDDWKRANVLHMYKKGSKENTAGVFLQAH